MDEERASQGLSRDGTGERRPLPSRIRGVPSWTRLPCITPS
jgi:hypothetical protein